MQRRLWPRRRVVCCRVVLLAAWLLRNDYRILRSGLPAWVWHLHPAASVSRTSSRCSHGPSISALLTSGKAADLVSAPALPASAALKLVSAARPATSAALAANLRMVYVLPGRLYRPTTVVASAASASTPARDRRLAHAAHGGVGGKFSPFHGRNPSPLGKQ